MRKDTIATRAKIIATAERLFAEQGVDAVSLNEITREADQKNKSALSYHFGNKEGLIQAIIDKHNPALLAARDGYLDELEQQHGMSAEGLARAVVYALAQKLDDADGGRYYLSVLAQLASSGKLSQYSIRDQWMNSEDRLMVLGTPFFEDIPQELRLPRILQATNMLLHSLSYLARVLDKKAGTVSLRDNLKVKQVFIDNLVDGLVAITSAKPSQQTQLALAEAV